MKKLFYLLIGILLLPSIVKAEGPKTIEYKAMVSNPDGVDIYACKIEFDDDDDSEDVPCEKTGEKVPYGTIYTLTSDDYICLDDDCEKFIDPRDLTAIDEFQITNENLGLKHDAIILNDVEIKKGPGGAYQGTGKKIKAGTKLSITEVTIKDGQTCWFYVEYDGVKGFIYSYFEDIAYDLIDTTIILISHDSYKIMYDYSKDVSGKLQVGVTYNVKLGKLNSWSSNYYIEAGNIKGLISTYSILFKQEPIIFELNKDINLYKTGLDISEDNIKDKVSKNTTITCEYYDDEMCYYMDKDGWIYIDEAKESSKSIQLPETELKHTNDNEIGPKNNDKDASKYKINNKDYSLYIYVGIGIILVVFIITIIILEKKKKHS